MKSFHPFKQTIITACIAIMLIITGTACSGKAPAGPPQTPENTQAPGDPTQPSENGQVSTDPSQAPENTQALEDSTQPSENSQASANDQPAANDQAATEPQPSEGAQAPTKSQPSANSDQQVTSKAQEQLTLEEAKNTALAHAGLDSSEVNYTKEKLDYEKGNAVYEIEFYTSTQEYEYEINAVTGEIYSMHTEAFDPGHSGHSQGHSQHSGNNSNASSGDDQAGSDIGIESAKSIALTHAGFSASEVTFKKTEADREDGQAVYEIEFYKDHREYEYTILASDGTILEYEID